MLEKSDWASLPRLEHYLKDPNAVLRYEVAAEIAGLFEQYITYHQDWMNAWVAGDVIAMRNASPAQVDDQAWEAELWQRISTDEGAAREHPAHAFVRRLKTADAKVLNTFGPPHEVNVYCLPDSPPLYLDVLNGLARMLDVTLYVLNPCREYWFNIVPEFELLLEPLKMLPLGLKSVALNRLRGVAIRTDQRLWA